METRRMPQHCKWATPTLSMPSPIWLEAWEFQWSCLAEGRPRVITGIEQCLTCELFEKETGAPGFSTPTES